MFCQTSFVFRFLFAFHFQNLNHCLPNLCALHRHKLFCLQASLFLISLASGWYFSHGLRCLNWHSAKRSVFASWNCCEYGTVFSCSSCSEESYKPQCKSCRFLHIWTLLSLPSWKHRLTIADVFCKQGAVRGAETQHPEFCILCW